MLALAATILTLAAPAPVQNVAFDAPQLAYASSHTTSDCDRIRIWNRATGRTVRLGRSTSCEQTSTGSGIASLAVAGNRVLWLFYAGGNIREWSLFTATTTAPKPRQLRFIARDVDEPAPIIVGEGDTTRFGDLLPYAVDRQVIVLRPNGSRAFAWTAPARVTALAANWGGVAVALEDGRVFVLENGVVESSWSGGPAATAVFVTGNGVVAQRGRTIEFRSGSSTRRWAVPAGARLRDAEGLRAVYLAARRARLLNLSTGATRDLGRATDVQLESATAVVAAGRSIRLVRIA